MKPEYDSKSTNSKRRKMGLSRLVGCVGFCIGGITTIALVLNNLLTTRDFVKTNEARTYVGSLNRGNAAYWLENGHFADDIDSLGVGTLQKPQYSYHIELQSNAPASVMATAMPLDDTSDLPSYIGAVFAFPVPNETSPNFVMIICKGEQAGTAPEKPFLLDGPEETLACGPGTVLP